MAIIDNNSWAIGYTGKLLLHGGTLFSPYSFGSAGSNPANSFVWASSPHTSHKGFSFSKLSYRLYGHPPLLHGERPIIPVDAAGSTPANSFAWLCELCRNNDIFHSFRKLRYRLYGQFLLPPGGHRFIPTFLSRMRRFDSCGRLTRITVFKYYTFFMFLGCAIGHTGFFTNLLHWVLGPARSFEPAHDM